MIVNPVNITGLSSIPDLVRFIAPFMSQVGQAFNNQITFNDNLRSSSVAVMFPVAGQNIQFQHKLPATPQGYFVSQASTFMLVCNGMTASTLGSTFANLMCNVSGATATIVFF